MSIVSFDVKKEMIVSKYKKTIKAEIREMVKKGHAFTVAGYLEQSDVLSELKPTSKRERAYIVINSLIQDGFLERAGMRVRRIKN